MNANIELGLMVIVVIALVGVLNLSVISYVFKFRKSELVNWTGREFNVYADENLQKQSLTRKALKATIEDYNKLGIVKLKLIKTAQGAQIRLYQDSLSDTPQYAGLTITGYKLSTPIFINSQSVNCMPIELRQRVMDNLFSHEIGHALGLNHSKFASVMLKQNNPQHPHLTVKDRLDLAIIYSPSCQSLYRKYNVL